jgi:hypothetical protein
MGGDLTVAAFFCAGWMRGLTALSGYRLSAPSSSNAARSVIQAMS